MFNKWATMINLGKKCFYALSFMALIALIYHSGDAYKTMNERSESFTEIRIMLDKALSSISKNDINTAGLQLLMIQDFKSNKITDSEKLDYITEYFNGRKDPPSRIAFLYIKIVYGEEDFLSILNPNESLNKKEIITLVEMMLSTKVKKYDEVIGYIDNWIAERKKNLSTEKAQAETAYDEFNRERGYQVIDGTVDNISQYDINLNLQETGGESSLKKPSLIYFIRVGGDPENIVTIITDDLRPYYASALKTADTVAEREKILRNMVKWQQEQPQYYSQHFAVLKETIGYGPDYLSPKPGELITKNGNHFKIYKLCGRTCQTIGKDELTNKINNANEKFDQEIDAVISLKNNLHERFGEKTRIEDISNNPHPQKDINQTDDSMMNISTQTTLKSLLWIKNINKENQAEAVNLNDIDEARLQIEALDALDINQDNVTGYALTEFNNKKSIVALDPQLPLPDNTIKTYDLFSNNGQVYKFNENLSPQSEDSTLLFTTYFSSKGTMFARVQRLSTYSMCDDSITVMYKKIALKNGKSIYTYNANKNGSEIKNYRCEIDSNMTQIKEYLDKPREYIMAIDVSQLSDKLNNLVR